MADTQSTDKNEGSSSDAAQLQTESQMAPKGTREVGSSLVITQLLNCWDVEIEAWTLQSYT